MRARLFMGVLLALANNSSANPLIEPDRHVPLVQFRSGSQHENDPALAFVGMKGLMVWKESGGGSASATNVHLAVTSDGGASWTSLPPLPRPPFREAPPVLVAGPQEQVHYLSSSFVQADLYQLRLETADLASGSVVWVRSTLLPVGHSAIVYPDMACDRSSGALHITYTHYDDLLTGWSSMCRVYYVRSPDGGTTWSTPVVLSGEGSDRSRVALGPDGEVYVAWVDALAERVRLRRSDDGGASFGPAVEVGTFLDNRNTGMYEWWEPSPRPHPLYEEDMAVPNTPRLAVDHSAGPTRGRVHLAWTDHAEGVPGPRTGGRQEREPNETIETATLSAIGEDIGGSLPGSEEGGDADVWAFDAVAGQVLELTGTVAWSPTPSFPETKIQVVSCEGPGGGLVQLARTRVVRRHDAGPPALDVRPMVVTLPRTGRYYIVVTGSATYSILYGIALREWQVSTGSAARDHRDVVVISSADRGASWGAKRRVGDAPHRYDESHPELLVDTSGRLHVTWLDRRHEPGCGAQVDTYWEVSFDGGGSFTPGQRLSSASTTWAAPAVLNEFPGQRTALAQSGEWMLAAWPDKREVATQGADIWTTRMQVGGLVSTAVASFGVEASATGARVTWRLHDARGLVDVVVERAEAEGESFARIAAQSGDPTREGEHVVVDGGAQPGATHRYRLALRFGDGRLLHEAPVAVTLPQRSLALAWEPPTPNPTVGRTRLALSLPREGHVEVEVYDVAGQRVARLHRGELPAGRHDWQWPAASESAAPGIYLVRAAALGESRSARVIVTR